MCTRRAARNMCYQGMMEKVCKNGFVISIVADPDTEQVIWDLSDTELLLPLTSYSLEKLHKFYQNRKIFRKYLNNYLYPDLDI